MFCGSIFCMKMSDTKTVPTAQSNEELHKPKTKKSKWVPRKLLVKKRQNSIVNTKPFEETPTTPKQRVEVVFNIHNYNQSNSILVYFNLELNFICFSVFRQERRNSKKIAPLLRIRNQSMKIFKRQCRFCGEERKEELERGVNPGLLEILCCCLRIHHQIL